MYTGYQSNDPKMGMVEFQRVSVEKDEYIETWNKIPTENHWTSDQIMSMKNNGFKWDGMYYTKTQLKDYKTSNRDCCDATEVDIY